MFKVGQKVIALDNHTCKLTEGKEYEVIEYIPGFRCEDAEFGFPESVTVLDNFVKPYTTDTWRFTEKE